MNKKNKGDRPTKKASEKRRYAVLLRLNTIENFTLKSKAAEVGLSRNNFLRELVVKSEIKARITIEQMKEIRDLTSMANNLNQIAIKLNTYGEHAMDESIQQLQEIIAQQLKDIRLW